MSFKGPPDACATGITPAAYNCMFLIIKNSLTAIGEVSPYHQLNNINAKMFVHHRA